jgi:DNA-binding transcriptional MocR family regulator
MRKIHEERQAAYIAAFEENLSAYFTLAPAGAGLDLVAYPTDKLHGSKMAAEAAWVDAVRRAGLSALALSGRYRERKAKEGMLLGFACFDEKTIKSNISKLARYMLEQTGF